MRLDSVVRDAVGRRFGAEAWHGVNRLEDSLFIWQLQLGGDEFPGWRVERVERVELPGELPALHALWRRADRAGEDALIAVDAVECPSRADAHDALVELLAQFQLPGLSGPVMTGLGDVAFVVPNRVVTVFARANLAFSVRSAGRDAVPVSDAAHRLDDLLTARPEPGEGAPSPRIARFERAPGAAVRVAASPGIALRLEAEDPLQRPLWYKLFASSGDVRLEPGGARLYLSGADEAKLSAYAVPVGNVAHQSGRADLTI